MRVIIMRHGDAVFQGAERILSSRGEQEARLTGLKLVSAFNITKIFCSSKYRAQQTAQIVHSLLRGSNVPEVQVINELNPYGNASLVRDYLEATCDDNDTVVLVSHIPQVLNLSWIFCQQELNLPTFFTAGALVLESKKTNESNDVPRYCPCWFLAPDREVKLITASSTPSAAASAYAAAALAVHEAAPVADSSYIPAPAVESAYISSSVALAKKAPVTSSVVHESLAVAASSLSSTSPSSPSSPVSPFAAIPSVSTFELQAKRPNNTMLAQFVANQGKSLNTPTYNASSRVPASSVATASVAAAAVAATALVGPASALVAPAVELGETGSLALPLAAAAVAAASVTIPVVRKVQGAPSHDYNAHAQRPQKISAATSCNSHSKRMLAKLARSSL